MPERRREYLSRTIPLSHPIRNEIIWSKNPTIPRINPGFNTQASEQLRRLCSTSFTYSDSADQRGHNLSFVDRWSRTPSGRLEVQLGSRFFAMASATAVPLDAELVRRLRRSPLTLDLYVWLTYRVRKLERETLIPWKSLASQFGSHYRLLRQFRAKFRKSLASVTKAWPELRAEAQDRGLLVRPGPPSVAAWIEPRGPQHAETVTPPQYL